MKADDLDGVSDPKDLDSSIFRPGMKYTSAGWTAYDGSKALKSDLSLTPVATPSIWSGMRYTLNVKATLNKDDVTSGNTILLGSIQQVINGGQPQNNMLTWRDDVWVGTNDVYFDGQHIGKVTIGHDHSYSKPSSNPGDDRLNVPEADVILVVDKDKKFNFASNPTVEFHTMKGGFQVAYTADFPNWKGWKGVKLPATYSLVTPNHIYNTTWSDNQDVKVVNNPYSSNIYLDALYTTYGINPKINAQDLKVHRVLKFQPSSSNAFSKGQNFNDSFSTFTKWEPLLNENGERTNESIPVSIKLNTPITEKATSQDVTPEQLYNNTPSNTLIYNLCPDGSLLVGINIDQKNMQFDQKDLEYQIRRSYYTNVQAPDKEDQVVSQNIKDMWNTVGAAQICHGFNLADYGKDVIVIGTDVTPNTDSNNLLATVQGPHTHNGSTFDADLYKNVVIHYIDDSNGNTVANDSMIGVQDKISQYKVNIPNGYVLDTKSPKNVDGKQYKWSADKKSIAYTFADDQNLNNANPINIYITHGTHNTNDNSGKSTRTIQYTGLPDNLKPKDNVQTVLFKRSGVTDDVTGETTYGDWQPQAGNGHYTAVTSPTFAGYKPDQAVVPDTVATAGKDKTVTVNYSRTDQNAKLTVHDDTANTDLNDYAENSTGLYQDQINFKTAPSAVEQELKDKGYNIVSDSFKGSPTYNADDSKNNFVIHVTHKIVPVTPDHPKTPTDVIPDTKQHYPTGVDTNDLNKDVQRSIFYKYEDNTQAEPTVVQKAHFDRTVKVDAVTQKIVDNGTWSTKDSYPEVATKSIDGYTPDKTKVGSATPSMTTNQDQTVVYHANDEDAAITYIDDTTGKVLKTDTQKAKYKQTIKFATDPNTQIQTYKDQGYVLVSSDWKDDSTYQNDPARNKFTVHLKHGISTVTPDNPKTPTDIIPGTKQHYPTGVDTNDLNQPQQRQITYTYADSKKQASPTVTQKATFHRTATVDNVTGKTTYTDWTTSDQYPEVKSPTIEGYTPNRQTVPATKPELNQKQDVAVVYNPNPEQVDVIAKDNTDKQLSKSTLHGNYNTDYSATTPVIKGYHLIKMPTNTHGTYKTHNDPIIYIYAPDSNSVPEQTDGTPKPDKSSYPNDLTPAKRSTKLPETGSINFVSDLNSVVNNITHALQHLLH